MMCHPILDSHGEVIAVAQVINKGKTLQVMAIRVVEFSREGYKMRKDFGSKSTVVK